MVVTISSVVNFLNIDLLVAAFFRTSALELVITRVPFPVDFVLFLGNSSVESTLEFANLTTNDHLLGVRVCKLRWHSSGCSKFPFFGQLPSLIQSVKSLIQAFNSVNLLLSFNDFLIDLRSKGALFLTLLVFLLVDSLSDIWVVASFVNFVVKVKVFVAWGCCLESIVSVIQSLWLESAPLNFLVLLLVLLFFLPVVHLLAVEENFNEIDFISALCQVLTMSLRELLGFSWNQGFPLNLSLIWLLKVANGAHIFAYIVHSVDIQILEMHKEVTVLSFLQIELTIWVILA